MNMELPQATQVGGASTASVEQVLCALFSGFLWLFRNDESLIFTLQN